MAATWVFLHTAMVRVSWSCLSTIGMKPAEVLRAATSVAAKVLRLDDRLGADQTRPSGRPCLCRGRPDPGHQSFAPGQTGDEGRRPLSGAVNCELTLSVSTTNRPSGCIDTTVIPGRVRSARGEGRHDHAILSVMQWMRRRE